MKGLRARGKRASKRGGTDSESITCSRHTHHICVCDMWWVGGWVGAAEEITGRASVSERYA